MMKAPYKNTANGLASLGRYEDNYIIHAAEGETVVPEEVLNANPKLKDSLFKQMRSMGIENPERYIVGNELNSINPATGQPEFFFKSIGKVLKKAAPIIGSVVGFAVGGPIGSAIGSGIGSLAGGASPEQALVNAGLSFAGSKFVGPALDKGINTVSGFPADSAPYTLGGEGVLPESISNIPVGTAATLALAPVLGKGLMEGFQPEEIDTAGFSGPSVVDQYYAALARGENPPLPAELTPPSASQLLPGTYTLPANYAGYRGGDIVAARPMFAAAYGGYIKGPGTATSDSIPTLLSNTEFVQTGKAVAGADPTGQNNPDKGAKVMMGIMKKFENRADENARAMA
jgi:hypothetical protein